MEAAQEEPRSSPRAEKLLLIGLALVVLIAAIAIFRVPPNKNDVLAFKASSAFDGFSTSGRVGDTKGFGVFFHTREESNPWVEIDLGKVRKISRVTVKNREDCCKERAIPLVVSVRTPKGELVEVARHEKNFNTWDAKFAGVEAKAVRLSIPKTTIFHLSRVDID